MKFSLQQLDIFLVTAQTLSITTAAQKLKVSKPAVSQAIKQLETELKVPLFFRSTRFMRLTEEGKKLMLQCQRLQAEMLMTHNLIEEFHQQPGGLLRISSSPYFAESLLPIYLKKYNELYPNVNIEIIVEERIPDLDKENIDLVFGVSWPAPLDVVAKKIMQTRYVLCATPIYLKKYGSPKKLQDLLQHRLLKHSGRPDDVVALQNDLNISLQNQIKLNSTSLIKICAMQSMGIGQLHEYMVREELKKGILKEILIDAFLPVTDIYVYYKKQRYVQPKVKQFIELLSFPKKIINK